MNALSKIDWLGKSHAVTRFLAFVAFGSFIAAAAATVPKTKGSVLPVDEFEEQVRARLDLGRWQLLMIEKDDAVSLDATTVKQIRPDVHEAWERWDYNGRRKDRFLYSLHKVTVDCAQKRYKYTSMVGYDVNHNVVKTWTARSESEAVWQEMVPGSVSEAEYGLLCGLFPSFEKYKRPIPLRPLRNE